MKLGFIGLGNMAKAMIGGILKKEVVSATDIMGCAKSEASKEYASGNWGILIGEDNIQVAHFAEILVLAVKPQVLPRVVEQIKGAVSEDTVIVSIAAGVSMDSLGRMFGRSLKFVRCMPNTPALVGMGCTGVCCNELVTRDEMQQSLSLLQSFGLAEEVPEKLMDAVVGVSGSSPAYVFLFLEALADGAVQAGMPRAQAYRFAAQSIMGSAALALETGKHPGELKDMVCSPGGTTIEAVQVLEDRGFRSSVMHAVSACVERCRALSKDET